MSREAREAKRDREIERAMKLVYALMIAGTIAVVGVLGWIHHDMQRIGNDCTEQIMYMRQDLGDYRNFERPETTEAPEQIVTIAWAERDLIERVVAAEARGESYEGMIAVAQTIKDRGDCWNLSYTDVVMAPAQYADPYQGEVSAEVKQAVADVFDNGARAYEEPTTHFHNSTVHPEWADVKTCRGQIGNHYFYG